MYVELYISSSRSRRLTSESYNSKGTEVRTVFSLLTKLTDWNLRLVSHNNNTVIGRENFLFASRQPKSFPAKKGTVLLTEKITDCLETRKSTQLVGLRTCVESRIISNVPLPAVH